MDRAWAYSRGGASARTSNADSHSRSDCVLQSDQSTLMVKKTATVRLAVAMASLNDVRLVPSVRRRPYALSYKAFPTTRAARIAQKSVSFHDSSHVPRIQNHW